MQDTWLESLKNKFKRERKPLRNKKFVSEQIAKHGNTKRRKVPEANLQTPVKRTKVGVPVSFINKLIIILTYSESKLGWNPWGYRIFFEVEVTININIIL